jgi:hypothetical protein
MSEHKPKVIKPATKAELKKYAKELLKQGYTGSLLDRLANSED